MCLGHGQSEYKEFLHYKAMEWGSGGQAEGVLVTME